MTYRRGFQRLYAVLVLIWVCVLLFALPTYRLRFWMVPKEAYILLTREQYQAAIDAGFTPDEILANEKIRKASNVPAIGKLLWLVGMLLGPPVCGYLAVFEVVPWIYNGFKPATQI